MTTLTQLLATLVLILGALVVLQIWNKLWRLCIRREGARRHAEARALQQFMLDTNRGLQEIMDDEGAPLVERWARAEALLAEVASRNPTSDPGINAWIEDNRAYLEEQIGRRP